jgi:hypothetical protein
VSAPFSIHAEDEETSSGWQQRGVKRRRYLRASLFMNVCGPTAFPIQKPMKTTAAESCFFV